MNKIFLKKIIMKFKKNNKILKFNLKNYFQLKKTKNKKKNLFNNKFKLR